MDLNGGLAQLILAFVTLISAAVFYMRQNSISEKSIKNKTGGVGSFSLTTKESCPVTKTKCVKSLAFISDDVKFKKDPDDKEIGVNPIVAEG